MNESYIYENHNNSADSRKNGLLLIEVTKPEGKNGLFLISLIFK